MTLQQLEYVVAVAEHRHFLKAAEACDVTQPTLSSMIQKLEEELGIKIFDRKQKPIVTTSMGENIVEQARLMLRQVKNLRDSIAEEKQSLNGTFRIGILPTIAPYLIPRFFPRITRKYPHLDLRITEMKTHTIKQSLDRGEIDAGILAQLDGMDEYETNPLFFEQYFVYVSDANPLHNLPSVRTTDLRDQPLWLLDEGHCFRDQLVKFCHLKGAIHSQKAYKLGSIETFMRMVESGMGATFIPELCTLQLSPAQQQLVRPFAVPVPTREVVMLTSKDIVRRSLLRILVEEIRQSVPSDMLKLSKTQKRLFE
ncbi:LysR family transcriptional regulator [Alloprevotella sp. OH1205_COT-284]|uniref:LysR substrate-binding domain-containing protein n=1 Tax=Alloprevotella sp. OH1205_COT-284 TaxID=2491043 RepID=UPI000F5F3674|nr:LysR substrate-binding domain-containing protein [Alloprevotella sp. OH1205_COT-284]RRD80895.1 LysR family transcriptional regulator [Alloprevotella sp. OH1205_COT-284]